MAVVWWERDRQKNIFRIITQKLFSHKPKCHGVLCADHLPWPPAASGGHRPYPLVKRQTYKHKKPQSKPKGSCSICWHRRLLAVPAGLMIVNEGVKGAAAKFVVRRHPPQHRRRSAVVHASLPWAVRKSDVSFPTSVTSRTPTTTRRLRRRHHRYCGRRGGARRQYGGGDNDADGG